SHLVRAIYLGGVTVGLTDRQWGHRAGSRHLGGCAMCRREPKRAGLREQLYGSRLLPAHHARSRRGRGRSSDRIPHDRPAPPSAVATRATSRARQSATRDAGASARSSAFVRRRSAVTGLTAAFVTTLRQTAGHASSTTVTSMPPSRRRRPSSSSFARGVAAGGLPSSTLPAPVARSSPFTS